MQALKLLCETIKARDMVNLKHKERRNLSQKSSNSWVHLEESAWESFDKLCFEIVQLIDDSADDLDTPVKLAAVSALEVLANKFSSNTSIFNTCLISVSRHIGSNNLALSSSCLRTTGSLINVLGPRALAELPHIMKHMLNRAHDVSLCLATKVKRNQDRAVVGYSSFKESYLMSVLVTLEAVINKLGGFLNPYLGDIIELMVLHPEYALGSDLKMKLKADIVRRLVTEKIPVSFLLKSTR